MPIKLSKTDTIMHSINLSYLGFEEDFLFFFWIELLSFLIFFFSSALMFLFRFSLFVPSFCFFAFFLLSSFWFFWLFLCRSSYEPSLDILSSLSLPSLNSSSWTEIRPLDSSSWTERRIKEKHIKIACLPGEIMLPLFEFMPSSFLSPWHLQVSPGVHTIEISIDFYPAAKR